MTKDEQKKFFHDFTAKMEVIMLSKGDDYAGADRLSNFKVVGNICGLKAEQSCLALIATKVARLGQLLSGKVPNNESIEDSLLDLANYTLLLAMIRADNKPAHAV
jgi:hypothetical protein